MMMTANINRESVCNQNKYPVSFSGIDRLLIRNYRTLKCVRVIYQKITDFVLNLECKNINLLTL